MKKATLLAFACALFMGQSLAAQEASQEVTFVPDETQGVLVNRFKNNWFITGEVGASMYFSKHDVKLGIGDRITPAGSIYLGKWFSPVFGLRAGVNVLPFKGLSSNPEVSGVRLYESKTVGYWNQKTIEVGPVFDAMVNLTNWWCGYKPGRIYNATFYVGAGQYWTLARKQERNDDAWANANNNIFSLRTGIINAFNVSKQVQLSLDIRWSAFSGMADSYQGYNPKTSDLQAYLGVTYNFNKRDWSAPVVPVCPEPENCDALRARLSAADARIADLEAQLRDCLNRPVEKSVEKGPVATIYYPIGVSRLTREDRNILGAIANVMKSNPKQHYLLTGWADNYTGTEQINIRLRHARVNGVAKELKKNGVAEDQITATINNGSLCDLGEKYVALDRAVTIEEVK